MRGECSRPASIPTQLKASVNGQALCRLQELEACKSQLAALQRQQPLHPKPPLPLSPGKENGATALGPTAAAAAAEALGGGSAGGPSSLLLEQQLAEARHSAAQLQIELEAAQAKLAIYRRGPGLGVA